MTDSKLKAKPTSWNVLDDNFRDALAGKLTGLWGAVSDESAFNSCPVDKQQTLLLMVYRLKEKGLWQLINKIDNVYGEGGVGIGFSAWPLIISTLTSRNDFTRLLANHRGMSGGFYEKRRAAAVLHFIYKEGKPQKWYVHFDLYSPVHSPISAYKHFRHEFLGKLTPDWQMIQERLYAEPSRIGA
ncbi:MAG: hypothetical protein ABJC10_00305 [Acidobacteriota bacterium]